MQPSDVFLSYSRADADQVQRVKEILKARGIRTFLDRDDLTPGEPWPQALEETLRSTKAVAVFIGREIGGWQKREIAFSLVRQEKEERAGKVFRVVPILLPGSEPSLSFLFLASAIDLRRDLLDREGLDALERAIRGEASREQGENLNICPYRGLKAFREEDAAFFCGREAFAEKLYAATIRGGFVPVIGPSGSGKSSVVFAGLIPMLRREAPPKKTWDVASFTPGEDPFHRLARVMIPLLERDLSETDQLAEAQKLGSRLQAGEVRLSSVVGRILEKSDGTDRLLLVIDQCEELFTLSPRNDRQALVRALLEAQSYAAVTIVASLRADFYGHAISLSRELSDRMAPGQVTLGMMTRDELRRAMEQPAHRVGLVFEDGLVDRILDDVGEEPGNIPLLAFALAEMWVRRKQRLLQHAAYADIGAVQGAVAQRAEEEFSQLPQEQQIAARRVFTTRLVRVAPPSEAGDDTRRQADLEELDHTALALVQRLADARLLVTGRDPVSGKDTVQVAHEALIRNWARLRSWIDEDREFLLWRQRFREKAAEWKSGTDDALLLRGALLEEAGGWMERRPQDFAALEQQYVQAGFALRKREQNQQRRTRLFIGIGSMAALLTLVYFGGIARVQSQHAADEAKIAEARSLAAFAEQARSETDGYLDRSALLAVESLRHAPLFEGIQAIRPAATLLPHSVLTLHIGQPVTSIAYSPDGAALAVTAQDKMVHLYSMQTGQELWHTVLSSGITGRVVFSKNGRYIATPSADKTARLLDAKTGREMGRIVHQDSVEAVVFSPNSRYLASAGDDKTVRLLDISTGQVLAPLSHPERVSELAFSPDGKVLVTGGSDYFARIYETAHWRLLIALDHHMSFAEQLTFNSDGSLLATADQDRNLRVFETAQWKQRVEYKFDTGIRSLAFTPNGRYVAVGGNGGINLVEASTGKVALQIPAKAEVLDMRFAHNGPFLAWRGDDDAVRVLADPRLGETEWIVHPDGINQMAISPDDRFITTASADGTGRVSKIENLQYTLALVSKDDVASGAISPDGRRVALLGDGGLDAYELPSGQRLGHQDTEGNHVMEAVAFNTDGSKAVLGDWGGLGLFDVGRFALRAQLKQEAFVKAVAFSADGRYVAFGKGVEGKDVNQGTAIVVNASTLGEVCRFSVEGSVTALAFSADGNRIATGSADIIAAVLTAGNRALVRRVREDAPEHMVRIFDIHSKREVAKVQVQSSSSALSFSPDGKYLGAGGTDGTARIIATDGWKEMWRVVHQGAIRAVTFSHDGHYLATGSDDHTARVI